MTIKYFNVKNGLTTGNITLNASNGNAVATTFIGNVNVTNSANLGSVSNVKITGGTANYVLSTDGSGNLSWVAQSGGGSGTPGGSNTQIQFNDSGNFAGNAGLTFNKTSTTLTANNFVATSTANLGSVSNVTISGGSTGQVLTTDGTGNLSWANNSVTATVDNFVGNGVRTVFTLSTTPANINLTTVNYNGVVLLRTTDYTLSGANITISSAPENGSDIQVTTLSGGDSGGGGGGGSPQDFLSPFLLMGA